MSSWTWEKSLQTVAAKQEVRVPPKVPDKISNTDHVSANALDSITLAELISPLQRNDG